MVHTKTLFLAKTVTKYPRKHRDLSSNGVLNDAVEALEEFKDVEAGGSLPANEDEGLSFWFEDGILTEIQWEIL